MTDVGMATALELAAAAGAAGSGALVLLRRTAPATGWLLMGAAVTILPVLDSTATAAVPFTLSLLVAGAAGPLAPALAAVAGSVWPVLPLRRPEVAVATAAIASTGVLGGLLPALLFDAQGTGCNACPYDLLLLHASVTGAAFSVRSAQWLTLVWGPLLAAVALQRWRRASPLIRRSSWPMLAGGAGIALLATVSAEHGLRLPAGQVDDRTRGLWLAQCALVLVVCAGIVVRHYRVRTAAARIGRLVLAAIPEPGLVVGTLRRTVGDPTLTVCVPLEDGQSVDLDGAAVSGRAGRAVVLLSRGDLPVAEIRFDPQLAGSADLVRASVASTSLALEYLAARAQLRAQLAAATTARARLVAAGDAERRRLERNLHDGAQQRLIALGMMLAAAAPSSSAAAVPASAPDPSDRHDRDRFRAAHAQIDQALEELRSVARGLFPTSLTEGGLTAALRELGDHTACPLVVRGSLGGQLPPVAAMAMYQAVAELARISPPGTPVTVTLDGGGDVPARITVTSPQLGADDTGRQLLHAEDRFVAAGGHLTATSTDQGLMLQGVAPCGS